MPETVRLKMPFMLDRNHLKEFYINTMILKYIKSKVFLWFLKESIEEFFKKIESCWLKSTS